MVFVSSCPLNYEKFHFASWTSKIIILSYKQTKNNKCDKVQSTQDACLVDHILNALGSLAYLVECIWDALE